MLLLLDHLRRDVLDGEGGHSQDTYLTLRFHAQK
jgi:hypothetical protein